jgi:hypothetical protein
MRINPTTRQGIPRRFNGHSDYILVQSGDSLFGDGFPAQTARPDTSHFFGG